MKQTRIFSAICESPWLIEPSALRTMISIVNRSEFDVHAAEAKRTARAEPLMTALGAEGVAVIPLMGPIFRYANIFTEISGATSLELLAQDFDKAVNDPSINRIILNIDSPGGQASGIAEFADMVRASPKKVTAYVGDLCASAAYWIAAGCDDIAVAKTASLGSIGVVLRVEKKSDDGLIEIVSTQSPKKRVSPETADGAAELQAHADALAEIFINSVASFRGVDDEFVMSKFGKGGVLIGARAVRAKMADRVSSFDAEFSASAGGRVQSMTKISNQTRVKVMDKHETSVAIEKAEVTVQALELAHPDLVAKIKADAFADGVVSGRAEELNRIKAIEGQASLPGHDALVQAAKYDGKTTAAELALQVVAQEKATRAAFTRQFVEESVNPVVFAPTPVPVATNSGADNLPVEERCALEWAADADLRGEFGDIDVYVSYARAAEAGRVRIKSSK